MVDKYNKKMLRIILDPEMTKNYILLCNLYIFINIFLCFFVFLKIQSKQVLTKKNSKTVTFVAVN